MNNIFKSEFSETNFLHRSGEVDLDILEDAQIATSLNHYKIFNRIHLTDEPILDVENPDNKKGIRALNTDDKNKFVGRLSIFNPSYGVMDSPAASIWNNAPLIDSPATRLVMKQRADCSVKTLVKLSSEGKLGRAIYNYSDFMFCKYLGRMPNNYMITLRRFPSPAGDYINFASEDPSVEKGSQNHFPDIGRLVTWIGTPGNDMSSILKYSVNLPYEEMSAEVQEARGTDQGGGLLGGFMKMTSGGGAAAAFKGQNNSALGFMSSSLGWAGGRIGGKAGGAIGKLGGLAGTAPGDDSWMYHHDRQKPWGPVDSIAKTSIRSSPDKGGINFEQSIKLQFDYEMRSYDGINCKAAFLDLIGHILTVCFTNARYWGGAVHGSGASQSNVFANLPIFNMKDPLSWSGIADAGLDSIKQIGASLNNGKPITSFGDVLGALKNLGNAAALTGVGGILNAIGRPQKQGLNSLLNFAPTGVWHLTVGNPRHPIMSMGNMKLDSCEIQHIGPLGLDDFPTGLRVSITLSHAQPRDNLKIEQMYMMGDNRIYQPLGDRAMSIYNDLADVNKNRSNTTPNQNATEVADNKGSGVTNEEPQGSSSVVQENAIVGSFLNRFFGTDKQESIKITAMEAFMGSGKEKQTTQGDGTEGEKK